MSYLKPQSAKDWGEDLWAMAREQQTSAEFAQAAHRILVQGRNETATKREDLLRLCHGAPMAVEMDTRDLEAAIRRLVDFAWEATQ